MQPYAQVFDGEMFLTYASSKDDAYETFVAHGLPDDGRVRKQPMRAPDEFRYTRAGETVTATVVGPIPSSFQTPAPEDILAAAPIETPLTDVGYQ